MRIRERTCLSVLVVVLFLTGLPTRSEALSGHGVEHVVVSVEGEARLERAEWTRPQRLHFGMPVRAGDLITLSEDASVVIVCGDLRKTTLRGRSTSGIQCRESQDGIIYGGSRITATRGNVVKVIPIVLSPRRTKVIDPRPGIRWRTVEGVGRYTVAVRGCGVRWRRTVDATGWLPYPVDESALKTGSVCSVVIDAGGVTSEQEGIPDIGFQVLDASEVREVRRLSREIDELAVAEPARRYLQGLLYASRGLRAKAIEELEALRSADPRAIFSRVLGELYLDVILHEDASQRFREAIWMARDEGDIESLAIANRRLGDLNLSRGDFSSSTQAFLRQAAESYETLGDNDATAEIRAEMKAIWESR